MLVKGNVWNVPCRQQVGSGTPIFPADAAMAPWCPLPCSSRTLGPPLFLQGSACALLCGPLQWSGRRGPATPGFWTGPLSLGCGFYVCEEEEGLCDRIIWGHQCLYHGQAGGVFPQCVGGPK